MAIRSSELPLPAAIELIKRYKELLKSKYIELDALNKRIIDIHEIIGITLREDLKDYTKYGTFDRRLIDLF